MKTTTLKIVPIVSFLILAIFPGTIFSEFANEAQLSENINQPKLGTHFKDMTLVDSSVSKSDEALNQQSDQKFEKVTFLQGSRYFLQTRITKNKSKNLNKRANTHISEPDFATTMESSTVTFRSNEKLEKTAVSSEVMLEETISTSSSETGGDDISVYIVAGVAGAVGLAVVALFIFMILKVKRRKDLRRRSVKSSSGNSDTENPISIPDYTLEPVDDKLKSAPQRTESLEESELSSRKRSKLVCVRAWFANLYTVNE